MRGKRFTEFGLEAQNLNIDLCPFSKCKDLTKVNI